MAEKKKLGQILLDAELLDEFQLKSALGYQQKWGGKLGDVLVENHFITEEALLIAIQQQTGIAVVKLEGRTIPDYLKKLVPLDLIEKHKLVPIGLDGEPGGPSETLVIAMSDPTDLNALDELSFSTGKRVKPVLASTKEIDMIIQSQYHGASSASKLGYDLGDGAAGLADSMISQIELEAPSGADAPSSAGLQSEDPFSELDSLASAADATIAAAPIEKQQEASMDPFLDGDPFAELDALSFASSSEDGSLEIDLDHDGENLEELEELDILDDLEIIEESPEVSLSPSDASVPGLVPEQSDGQGLDIPMDLSSSAELEPAEPTPIIEAPAPDRNPLDDLPDLDPVSDDDAFTPPEAGLAQAPQAHDDPFSDGADLDLDDVLGVLSPQQKHSAQDSAVSTKVEAPEADEDLSHNQDNVVTALSDPVAVKNQVPISNQVTTIVQMPVAPELEEADSAEGTVRQAQAPQLNTDEVKPPKLDESGLASDHKNALQDDDGIKSSAMNELLSRVGLKKGQPGRQAASSSASVDTPQVQQSDAKTLQALVDVLLSKGIITEEELRKAKERS